MDEQFASNFWLAGLLVSACLLIEICIWKLSISIQTTTKWAKLCSDWTRWTDYSGKWPYWILFWWAFIIILVVSTIFHWIRKSSLKLHYTGQPLKSGFLQTQKLFEQNQQSLLRVQKHWCSCRKLPSVQFCRWICLSDLRADFHLNYDMEFSPFPFPLFSGLALSGWAGSVS